MVQAPKRRLAAASPCQRLDRPCLFCPASLPSSRIADADALPSDGSGWGALHWAAWRGDASRLSFLLGSGRGDAGALDAEDSLGRTPLSLAAGGGSVQCVELLLAAGAATHTPDAEGSTALHAAAAAGSAACVTALLSKHAPLAARDQRGRTALHLAALRCQPACMAALLDAADSRQAACDHVHGQDADGCTPLQLAEQRLQQQQLGEKRAPYQQPAGRLHDAQQTVCMLQAAAARLQLPERGCGG